MFPILPTASFCKEVADEVAATPVTFEPLETDPMPAELSDSLTETLYYETLNAPRTAIPRLKKLIGKFPRVPTLKNYLMTAYQLLGKHREHLRTAEAIVAEHPDYPFGRAGLATLRIEQGRVEEARELLGPSLRLRDLCPDRELFHVSEIGVYYAAAGVLRIAEGDLDGAQGVVEGLKRVDPERESIRMLQERLMLARIEHFQERMRRDKENEIRIEGPPVPKAVPVPSQPKPHQEELMALYEHDSDLPEESIRAILALPRESLIADLEGMLDRAVERAGGFLAEFDEDAAPYFPLHALLFLGELESWGSTDRVLRFLNENDELYQFWFSGESGWMFLFPFVKADPERFRQWMLEPDRPGYARSEISEAVAQMALHHPERREEAARWIESVLARLLEAKTGERLLDTHVVTNLVWDAATIRATNAEPLIREAYKRNLVSIQMIGNEPEVLADLHKSTPGPAKPRPGLLAFYRKMGEERQPADDEPEKDEAVETQAREAGRNDPCPCGSGKKFKKCCMK